MPVRLSEDIVDKLLSYFEANFEAKVADLNSEFSDEPLAAPLVYYAGEKALTQGDNYPAIMVVSSGFEVQRHIPMQLTDADHAVEMTVYVRGQDTGMLRRHCYRYVRAMWEMVQERFVAAADAGSADDYFAVASGSMPSAKYEPINTEASGPYVAHATLSIEFNKAEER